MLCILVKLSHYDWVVKLNLTKLPDPILSPLMRVTVWDWLLFDITLVDTQ